MKVSALIPYKPDFGRRDYLWSVVHNRYLRFLPQVEICIGTDLGEPFCRAKAINEAAKKASGDVFLLVDTDVVFNPDLIGKIISVIGIYPWIVPYRNGYRLTEGATNTLLSQELPLSIQLGALDYEYIEPGPGPLMNAMTRSCFEKIGGLDERFKGYGYEDVAMAISLKTLSGPHFNLEEDIFHLWHPTAELIPRKNVELWQRYVAAADNAEAIKNLHNERNG
ncbi:MAG TPA: glycosyltransferase [Bacillota bacterium]|nr:glycosyltransferase [Bacillota bacterium]